MPMPERIMARVWAIAPGVDALQLAAARSISMSDIAAFQLAASARAKAASDPPIRDGVAVISLVGPLLKTEGWEVGWFGGTSTQTAMRQLDAATKSKDVRKSLLYIDSPGGLADGVAEMADAIMAARQTKPVFAQIAGMAGSAAYAAASQAEKIYAGRMDMAGSIGSIMPMYDYSAMFAADGVEAVPIDSGGMKSAGMLGTKISDEHKAYFQGIVDAYAADFRKTVQRGRGMTAKQVEGLADGRMHMAADALKLGLIDGIATTDQTMARLSTSRTSARTRAEVAIMGME